MEKEMPTPEVKEEPVSELEEFIKASIRKAMIDGMKLKSRTQGGEPSNTEKVLDNIAGSKMEEINKWLNDPEKIRQHLAVIEAKTSKE